MMQYIMNDFSYFPPKPIGFEWDEGNKNKNGIKHGVDHREIEELFFNKPIFFFKDEKHSQVEERYVALGRTDKRRLLTIVFTIRNDLIRVISARPMSKRDRKVYEHAK